MPSAKYSCEGSPDRFSSGSTAMERKRGAALVGRETARTSQKADPVAARISSVSARAVRVLLCRALGGATATPSRVLLPFASEIRGAWTSSTGAMNLYPRRGSVSMYRGISAESPSTSRIRPMALWRLWSKSTKVSAGQSWLLSSSRVTTLPADCNNIVRSCTGWPCRRSLTPRLCSSPARRSSSNVSNRSTRAAGAGADIQTSRSSSEHITILALRSLVCRAAKCLLFIRLGMEKTLGTNRGGKD